MVNMVKHTKKRWKITIFHGKIAIFHGKIPIFDGKIMGKSPFVMDP